MRTMKDEQRQFLVLLGRPPARLTAEQVGWTLNFNDHDIPVLVAAGLLRPLGQPPANAVKFFAEVEIRKLAGDPDWLARATNAIHRHWQKRNGGRLSAPAPVGPARNSFQFRSPKRSGESALGAWSLKPQPQVHGQKGAG